MLSFTKFALALAGAHCALAAVPPNPNGLLMHGLMMTEADCKPVLTLLEHQCDDLPAAKPPAPPADGDNAKMDKWLQTEGEKLAGKFIKKLKKKALKQIKKNCKKMAKKFTKYVDAAKKIADPANLAVTNYADLDAAEQISLSQCKAVYKGLAKKGGNSSSMFMIIMLILIAVIVAAVVGFMMCKGKQDSAESSEDSQY